ncbi:MAG: uracil-DNA glycosylase family protein [candidate division WOR-3 bacterium]|nr:uracil-DNA glycosylase family protein [candidate division WOR-3 bacterium]
MKNQKKDNAIKQCIPLLKEELEAIQPNLIIVATHYFWKHFGKYKLYSTIEAIQNEKKSLLFSTEIINGLSLNNAMIAVFPNPSPTNYKHKVDFYKKGYVADLIEKIHNEIEKNYTNLP